MKTREAIAKRIEELCEQNNLTINGLATQAAVPASTVKNIIYGVSRNPGIVTIKMLCDGLGRKKNDEKTHVYNWIHKMKHKYRYA